MRGSLREIVMAGTLVLMATAALAGMCLADAAADFDHGVELYKSGNYDAAQSIFNDIKVNDLALAPEAERMIAACLGGKKQFQQAMDVLDQLIINHPDNPVVMQAKNDKAMVLLAGFGKASEARQLLSDLVSAYPDNASVVEWKFNIGMCYYTENNWSSARSTFASLYTNYPESDWHVQAKYTEGDCCMQMNDKDGAKAAFNEVADKFPGTSWADEANKRLSSQFSE